MNEDGSIQDMHTRELTIDEAKDLQKLTIDELIGNLKTNEMNKKKDHERREPKKEKNLVLKADSSDSSGDDTDMAYLKQRFQKKGYFIKDCPLHKQDNYKHNADKTIKRNPLPDSKFKRRDAADNVVKQALDAWGDSSSKSKGDDEQRDTSMMAVESEAAEYESIFAQMEKSDEEEDNDDDETVVKRSSQKWYMDNGCSKHMIGRMDGFLSLKVLQGESVSFGNGKKGYIPGV
ncbi:nucleolin 2-like [Nicotiana tomentosiformis]|uniref:nucleolin 2-like n=1 Tax=Nicotiana tomentosiformis TaxID=4098 RepID=UPI00388C4CC7